MQKVHESSFLIITWYNDSKTLHLHFLSDTEKMDEAQYKGEIGAYIKAIHTYKPKNILAHTTDFGFIITPALQEWVNEQVISLFPSIGLKKHAIVVSQSLFSQVSIAQTMDEAEDASFQNKYFEDESLAWQWIHKQ